MSQDESDGRDPRSGRFQKGQSGNTGGRPRKSKSVDAAIFGALHERVGVKKNGRRSKVSLVQAAATQIGHKAATGDLRAGKMALDMARKAEEGLAAKPAPLADLSASDEAVIQRVLARLRRIVEEENDASRDPR